MCQQYIRSTDSTILDYYHPSLKRTWPLAGVALEVKGFIKEREFLDEFILPEMEDHRKRLEGVIKYFNKVDPTLQSEFPL